MTTRIPRAVETPNFEHWTRLLGELPPGDEHVVFVPPDSPPGPAFEEVRRLVRAGKLVRLVMRGATAPSIRACLTPIGPLALTEIDAYLPGDMGPVHQELIPGFESWLRKVFAGAVEGIDVARAFWASSATRLALLDVFQAWCFARGICSRHACHEIINTDAGWIGAPALEALLAKRAGVQRDSGPTRAPHLGWRLRIFALGIVGAFAAIALRTREFVSERRTRKAIRSRKAAPAATAPCVWLGVIGCWAHSSRHVIGSLASAARERAEPVGILLQSTLRPGNLAGAFAAPRNQNDVLPVLSLPDLGGIVRCVDQCVSYESWGEFIAAIPGTLQAIFRACRQLAGAGPELDLGPFRIPLRRQSRALAVMMTLDILRAREAAAAASRFAERWACHALTIAWSHASLVSDVVPDLVLQACGARTLDVVHGLIPDVQSVTTTGSTFSTIKLLWTEAEARYLAPILQPRGLGGIPCRILVSRQKPRRPEPIRILILSNYATFVAGTHRRALTQILYQEILLDALRVAVDQSSFRLEIRWRPHPGDDPESVEQARRNFSAAPLALSRGRTLDEDLHWSDVVVASISSAVVEAIVHPVPILIHDIPAYEADAIMSSFPDCRRFRDERDLPLKLDRAIREALADGSLAPEAEMRRAFFGASGMPGDIGDVVFGPRAKVGSEE